MPQIMYVVSKESHGEIPDNTPLAVCANWDKACEYARELALAYRDKTGGKDLKLYTLGKREYRAWSDEPKSNATRFVWTVKVVDVI